MNSGGERLRINIACGNVGSLQRLHHWMIHSLAGRVAFAGIEIDVTEYMAP
jgi:hypothetical protein